MAKARPQTRASRSQTANTVISVVGLPPVEASSNALPALKSPSKDRNTLEVPTEDKQPGDGLTTDLPAGEVTKHQPTADSLPKGGKPPEGLTTIPLAAPAASKSSTAPLRSPSKGHPTTELLTVDQQIAEDPTTSLQAEKAPEDSTALESLPNVQSTTEGSTMDLPGGEILKGLTKNPSEDQSTAESQ
jgi:hypothetical protein